MNTLKGKKVLITGGTGLIGSRLTEMLLESDYTVAHLSRKARADSKTETFEWNPAKNHIDEKALLNVDYVIHLSGENIAAHRWTNSFKKQVIESRVQSAELLKKIIIKSPQVKAIICASGTGVYKDENEKWVDEFSAHDNSFPALTCEQWEEANSHYPCRTVILRTGLVLSLKGGALPELYKPFRFGIAPYFGNGNFYQSWIHIDDMCRMYIHAIENIQLSGIYNAVAPIPVPNIELVKVLQSVTKQFSIRVPVPPLMLKILLGEKSIIVLAGCRVNSQKFVETGFKFIYKDINSALKNIFAQ